MGTPRDDVLKGTNAADVIAGLGGNDTIRALGGDDHLCGDGGADQLFGGAGRDWLSGGAGRDTLTGGPGQGHRFGFDVLADRKSLVNIDFLVIATCQPAAETVGFIALADTLTIAADGSFSSPFGGSTANIKIGSASVSSPSDFGQFTGTVRGSFDATGEAAGTIEAHASLDFRGTHYECDSGTVTWAAA